MNIPLQVAVLCCAQLSAAAPAAEPKPATSRIAAVTVYQGQALVTREVTVPEGPGTMELVVSPLPPQVVEGSLYTEGTEGLRVLSTRYRARTVKEDLRQEVRQKEEQLRKLQDEARALQDQAAIHTQDIQFLQKLEGFTGSSLQNLTKEGRLDSPSILALSKYIMETRGEKAKADTALRERLRTNTDAIGLAKAQLAELSKGPERTEREAIIVVSKAKADAGTVRLGYLATAATWVPQYRLRGGADRDPVRLEYLAAVTQQTGEDWKGVRATLSTARPSLDASPPDLLPLNMAITEPARAVPPVAANDQDERSKRVVEELAKPIPLNFPNETPFEEVMQYLKQATTTKDFPDGLPTYIDPVGLQEADKTMTTPVSLNLTNVPLRTGLGLMLKQLGLTYRVKDGVLMIVSQASEDEVTPSEVIGGMGGGMGGFGGMSLELSQASGKAMLNRAAAVDQSRELRITDDGTKATATDQPGPGDGPTVSFKVGAELDIPSRTDPQLLEVARIELPADYFARATPVLSPRVYRLAKLINKSETVILPGEATIYAGSDFVGRMRLPLVAAGEPFLAGFGVDPQLQVARRLVAKSRSVQGGNQVFTYEFRLSLRNYRDRDVKLELWDRLPRPQGEAVAVSLVKTSAELSTDPLYLRTSRLDNLLRWDVTIPPATTGDKPLTINYEFRLEYARDLPQPRFLSGGLVEGPVGGGAMGGMGGMGGMR
ncbi:mucoidy inhibitor MuiA family protein [Aquisphaera insulae]|uniref:mucoidy inhibitor MuiA family protein n=1 Tax=Aquisphaera insulae TaxID=2712864 RepID=UPI0013EC4589|nr:mucoidy inhibitor MuiA family protein [Aquisphaera insulae]